MTIQEAIDRVDMLKPNKQPEDFKVKWLSELDGLIWEEIWLKHEPDVERLEKLGLPIPWPRPRRGILDLRVDPFDRKPGRYPDVPVWQGEESEEDEEQEPDPRVFPGYDEGTDRGRELLVGFPYDEIYTWWLMSKVDIQNQEIDKYNNDRTLFNNAYDTYSDYWTREHRPLSAVRELRL